MLRPPSFILATVVGQNQVQMVSTRFLLGPPAKVALSVAPECCHVCISQKAGRNSSQSQDALAQPVAGDTRITPVRAFAHITVTQTCPLPSWPEQKTCIAKHCTPLLSLRHLRA